MIRTLLVFAFLGCAVFFFLPWLLLWTLLTKSADTMYALSMKAVGFAMRIAKVRIRVAGSQNIPTVACVFVANHASNLDPLVLFPVIPRRVSVLIKKELLRIPVLSTGMRMARFVFVDRADRRSATASLEEAIRLLREGLSFAVFAEGTRSPDGRLRPFKRGALLMAIHAEAPIVPVSIGGTQHLMSKGTRAIRPGEVTVCFSPAIPVAQLSADARADLLTRVESAVAAGLPADQQPPGESSAP